MKKLNFILISVLFVLALPVQTVSAQANEIPADLVRAFKTGNADAVAVYMNDNVELVIPKINNFFAKQQAKSILADFFRKNPIKDFVVAHKGTKENASFLIGSLISSTGNYRVSVFARKINGQLLVYQLRIENPNE
jgi:hypothetical protein